MNLEAYETAAAVQSEANKLAREPLAPYWDRLVEIGKAAENDGEEGVDYWEVVDENILSIEDDGRILLAFGGPNVWLTPNLMMNGAWAGTTIHCEAPTMAGENAARDLYERLEEIKECR